MRDIINIAFGILLANFFYTFPLLLKEKGIFVNTIPWLPFYLTVGLLIILLLSRPIGRLLNKYLSPKVKEWFIKWFL